MADLENGVPVTPQTSFRLASVSKPITATAVMELWERHQLDLDAPVQKYCPHFRRKNSRPPHASCSGIWAGSGIIVRHRTMIPNSGTRSTSTIRLQAGCSFSRMTRWSRSRGRSSIIRRRDSR